MLFNELVWTYHTQDGRRLSQVITNADRSSIYRIVEDEPTGMFTVRVLFYRAGSEELRDYAKRMWPGFKADITTIACFIHDLHPWR